VLASRCGIKPYQPCTAPDSHYKPHNRELKRLRKQKIRAQRQLRAAQREHRGIDELRRLGLQYRQLVRKYHVALKKRNKSVRRVDVSRVRRECAHSFWRFVRRILDEDESTPPSEPAFDASTAQAYFQQIYSSQSKSFDCPPWLPPPSEPHVPFNNEDIQLSRTPVPLLALAHLIRFPIL